MKGYKIVVPSGPSVLGLKVYGPEGEEVTEVLNVDVQFPINDIPRAIITVPIESIEYVDPD